jgi:hypothetical protein
MKVRMKHLNSKELLERTQKLVAEERRITLELIEHLREIDRRLLFAEMGYGSLHEFAVKYLALSDGSAHRRIQSMRLIRDVPEAHALLLEGDLNLSTASQVQGFFQKEKKEGREHGKLEVVEQIKGLSQEKCQRKLFEISPDFLPQEKERIVSGNHRELRIVISEELYEKLQLLKGLLAHALPEASYAELLERLVDESLKKKIQKPERSSSNHSAAERTKAFPSGVRVKLPEGVKRDVMHRAGWRCQYEHQGRRCTSSYRLQIDHIIPIAQGGSNELPNLRALCRTHNKQQALAKLGFTFQAG